MNERSPELVDSSSESLARARQLVARHTSPVSPIWLTALLVASTGGGLFLAAMWATEPEPLPRRTNVAFALCLGIAFSWTAFTTHGLMHRKTLLVHQRVIAASMGLVFSAAFTLLGLAVTIGAHQSTQTLVVAVTGASFMAVATLLLHRALRAKRELEAALAAL
ncbi:MAG: hypothetical protein WD226_03545 [Planctomycetota bacterium]